MTETDIDRLAERLEQHGHLQLGFAPKVESPPRARRDLAPRVRLLIPRLTSRMQTIIGSNAGRRENP